MVGERVMLVIQIKGKADQRMSVSRRERFRVMEVVNVLVREGDTGNTRL